MTLSRGLRRSEPCFRLCPSRLSVGHLIPFCSSLPTYVGKRKSSLYLRSPRRVCLDYKFFEEEKTPGTVRPLSQIGAIIVAVIGGIPHLPSRYLLDWELPDCDLSLLASNNYAGNFCYLAGVFESSKFVHLIFFFCINSLMFQLNKAFQFLKRKPDILSKYYISTTISLFFSPLLEIFQAGSWSKDDLSPQTVSTNQYFSREEYLSLENPIWHFVDAVGEDFTGRDLPSKSWLLNVQLAVIPLFLWLLLYQ